jgi:glycerophosphoryl diester phosphodiesterase
VTAIFAHRGCGGIPGCRENTVEAFAAARLAGADGVELDVRATADGALAVHHDRHVPGVGDVGNLAAAALPADIPLLDDALAACSGLRVNVEIKGGPAEAVLVARLLHTWAADRRTGPIEVFVSSFNPESLAAAREVAPGVPSGLLIDWRADARGAIDQAVQLGCASLHPFVTQVDEGLLDAARERMLELHVWTVNADADIAAMGELGVEAIITDRVAQALAILRAGPGDTADGRVGSGVRNGGHHAG